MRCVVVRGAAGNFCAGGDIAEYPGLGFAPAQFMNKRMLRSLSASAGGVGEAGAAGAIAGAGASQGLLDELVAHAYDYADTPEHRAGIAAFLDRRTPRF